MFSPDSATSGGAQDLRAVQPAPGWASRHAPGQHLPVGDELAAGDAAGAAPRRAGGSLRGAAAALCAQEEALSLNLAVTGPQAPKASQA